MKISFPRECHYRYAYLGQILSKQNYLMDTFYLADVYLFTVLKWLPFFYIEIKDWPVLVSFMERIGSRSHVQAAIAAEEATQPV
ncbi:MULTISPECIES: glutathione binding-like protein [unclassified Serratia (in: enterobacteria)]|uniref:glutathione binding-like protein n=1 Tax=unclassified Serratia (in: enterobacteria) TaxID=2647522 RepID=UPI0021035C99|nr:MULTISPECIES: glutathione binding-like protein [unclassified Serratia (in: enterobacteria)]